MGDGVKMCDKHRWAFGMACPACKVAELEEQRRQILIREETAYNKRDAAIQEIEQVQADRLAQGERDLRNTKDWATARHTVEMKVERLEAVIADIEKAASDRRRLIRDGWNVELDRETGRELWVLNDPPLEAGKLLDDLAEENKRLKAGLEDARTGNRWRGDDIDRLKSKVEKQRLEIVNLTCAQEISDGDGCDVMVGCKKCGEIARYRSFSADEVEDVRKCLKDRDASIEKLKARIALWGLRKDITG